jgi:hypothetical protein
MEYPRELYGPESTALCGPAPFTRTWDALIDDRYSARSRAAIRRRVPMSRAQTPSSTAGGSPCGHDSAAGGAAGRRRGRAGRAGATSASTGPACRGISMSATSSEVAESTAGRSRSGVDGELGSASRASTALGLRRGTASCASAGSRAAPGPPATGPDPTAPDSPDIPDAADRPSGTSSRSRTPQVPAAHRGTPARAGDLTRPAGRPEPSGPDPSARW